MKFCRNCGGELSKEAKFCKHCGFNLTSKKESINKEKNDLDIQKGLYTKSTEADDSKDFATTEKLKSTIKKGQSIQLSSKAKIFISIAVALIVCLLVGFKIVGSMASYEKKIEKFETAIHNSDAKALASILTTESQSMEINEDSVSGLIEFYHEYPSEMNDLIRHLNEQGNEYEKDPDFDAKSHYDYDYYPINLIKNGKTLIFDQYDIRVSPVYFHVYTNYQDTEILLDGKVIDTATSDDYIKEFGPFLPGIYTFGAKYSSEYVNLETEREHTHIEPGYVSEVDLYLEADEVFFEIPYSESQAIDIVKLFINGEDTGINLMEQDTIGPLPTDGSLEVAFEGEFPWGTIKTDAFVLDSNYMNFSFPLNDEVKQLAQEKIIQYNQEYIKAYTTVDASVFTVASDNVVEDVIADATYDMEWGREYTGKFIGVNFYDEAFDFYYEDNNWYMLVGTDTIFEETSSGFFGSSDLEIAEKDIDYELRYDEENDDWSIVDVGYIGYMTKETEIQYREDEPKTYTSDWAEEDEGE